MIVKSGLVTHFNLYQLNCNAAVYRDLGIEVHKRKITIYSGTVAHPNTPVWGNVTEQLHQWAQFAKMIRLFLASVWLNADSMPHDSFLNDLSLGFNSRSRIKIITGYVADIIPTWKTQTDYLYWITDTAFVFMICRRVIIIFLYG